MKTGALLAQLNIETRMMFRRREVVFFSILLPAMFMLLFGSIFGNIVDDNGVKVINYLLPGYVVLAVMSVALVSLGITMANERQYGILKRLGATPLPRPLLLLGKMGAATVVVIAAVVMLLVLGLGFYGATITGDPIEIALVILLGIVIFSVMGLAVAGLVKGEAAPAALNAIYMPLLFLGGALLPLSQMPDWLQNIAKVLPSYHFTNALYEIMAQNKHLPDVWLNLLGMLVWGLASFILAVRTFKWE